MNPTLRVRLLLFACVLMIAALCGVPSCAGDDWLPILPEDLRMKDNPASPGAHAMILYREEQGDDQKSYERHYYRIKVFTDEGKKYGDIEIPYDKDNFNISGIKARTIRPDGSIVNFASKVYEKTIVKGRGIKFLAKTFTLPEVQAGSIIEYQYERHWDTNRLYSTRWIVQHELFTRQARFSLKPYQGDYSLRWMNYRVPNNKGAREETDAIIRLELENIPAFQEEEYMPPENALKARVDFYYARTSELNPAKFWRSAGKERSGPIEGFIGRRGGITQAVEQIVSQSDPAETKLRKLYERAQQIRNTSFERRKTEKEEKREKLKDNNNVEDVLKHGYGTGTEVNWLFVAMARAAGFQAYPLLGASRNYYFFNPEMLDPRQLNATMVLVRAGDKEYFLDPGTALCPFGLLPWEETSVQALRLDKDGGTFVTTPVPGPSVSRIERSVALKYVEGGRVEGKLSVTFAGLEALRRRLEARDEDEAGRTKSLTDEVKGWLPASAKVEMTKGPDWSIPAETMRAEFKLDMEGLGISTGRRMLLPVTIIGSSKERQFDHANRVWPIYFDYPFETRDEARVQLPQGAQVSNLPEPRTIANGPAQYEASCAKQGPELQCKRRLSIGGIFYDVDYYPALRAFFQKVRTGDEQQVVLQSMGSVGSN